MVLGDWQRLAQEIPQDTPVIFRYDGKKPMFVSEYGGIKWAPGEESGWGYGNAPKTEEEFLARLEGLTNALLENPCTAH